jgi:hypothetical protein
MTDVSSRGDGFSGRWSEAAIPCRIAAWALVAAALALAAPASAQLGGTPGSGPLTPDGARRGLGPPSISDSVPDLRLHSESGGIPGAGPPIDYGAGQRRDTAGARWRETSRRCDTPQAACMLPKATAIGSRCTCRLADGSRAKGRAR